MNAVGTFLRALLLCVTHVAGATTLYVNLNNTSPAFPYATWQTAATTIQDAVDAASIGDHVLVTNGIYDFGGRALPGGVTNRVVVTNAITLESVNGPALTSIIGYQVPGTTNGPDAVRCVYLGNGALLNGFTLTNGATHDPSGSDTSGGGVSGESQSATVSNCVLKGNAAAVAGGGAVGASLSHCWLSNNRALRNWGGGAASCALKNCLVSSNQAPMGGGAYSCTLSNCTIVRNFAFVGSSGSGHGGGLAGCQGYNCIIYYNDDTSGDDKETFFGSYVYCCTIPHPGRFGCITNEPGFVDLAGGNFRLQTNSPCINAGAILYTPAEPDLDNNPRFSGGKPDIGAFEFQNPSSVISYAWLLANGLPSDGSADLADPDNDHMNNTQEWIAGTDPHDSASLLRMFTPATGSVPGSVLLSWQSAGERTYFLQRATNLAEAQPWTTFASNVFSQYGTNYYQDYPPTGPNHLFYRVWTDPERYVYP